jgi:hypothetical protein
MYVVFQQSRCHRCRRFYCSNGCERFKTEIFDNGIFVVLKKVGRAEDLSTFSLFYILSRHSSTEPQLLPLKINLYFNSKIMININH